MKKLLSLFCLIVACTLVACGSPASSSGSSSSPNTPGGSSPHSSSSSGGSSSGGGTVAHTHADADNNNQCDVCFVSIQTTVDFYSINDLHGKFDDTYANIGVDEMTTYLRSAQTENENTVLLSAGDMWQGSAESNYTKGNIITEWMNDLGFAAMAMGNHEYDWGESFIQANNELANFPFLAINVYDKVTQERVDYCDASVMVETNGVKIGVIGAIGDCYSDIAVEQVQDVMFLTGNALTSLVKAESERLRGEGANIIVYVLHDGYDGSNDNYYNESLSSGGYVDLVFEGHQHQEVKKQDSYGVWHLQAGGDNSKGLSHAKIGINIITNELVVQTAEVVDSSRYQLLADDPIVDSLLAKYADKLAPINEVLGTNASYRNYDTLNNYAAKAYYAVGKARWGSDPQYQGKIVLGGGFIKVRSPYYLPAGEVTYGDLYPLFTFDNPLVLCEVSGSRLKSQFIESTNYSNYYGTDGTAIKNNVDDNETYYVVVDSYCANYNFNHLGYLKIVEYFDASQTFYSREAVVAYTRAGGLSNAAPDPETFDLKYTNSNWDDDSGNTGGDTGDTTTYTSIQAVHASSADLVDITVKGRVIAVGKTGFLISDGSGIMMFYTGSTLPTVDIDDTVVLSGNTNTYNNNRQFSLSNATYEQVNVSVPTYTAPTLQTWDNAAVEAYDGSVGQYVQVTANIYTSKSYINAEKLSSTSTKQLSLIAPMDDVLQNITLSSTPQEMVITGYTCYTVSGKFVYIMPTALTLVNDNTTTQTQTLSFDGSFGGGSISQYTTGNYGSSTQNNYTFEYYRAYRPEDETAYCMQLLPYIASASDGTLPGSLYNTVPIYGIQSVSITYKSTAAATLYTGDDRIAQMTAYTLPASSGYQTETFSVDTDNFLKIDANAAALYIQALSVTYTNAYSPYNSGQNLSGSGDYRLNGVTFNGTLVAGQSAVNVPIQVTYDGGSYQITQTKTYTYYTLEYMQAHPNVSLLAAAMLSPQDVAAYYTAFKQFPANYALKSVDYSWEGVEAVFGDYTRYVSQYSRTTGYASHVPYKASDTTYFEFDIALDNYGASSRGVGRVVAWRAGWDVAGYNDAPVCVYTDDHYASFQEYLNDGTFSKRFDAEMNVTNTVYASAQTL